MDFREYYTNVYLPAHRKRGTRIAHFTGVVFTIIWFLSAVWFNLIWMLILTPLVVYPFAWSSHYFVEKNRPLAFSNVWLAKASDLVMCYEMVTGKLDWGE